MRLFVLAMIISLSFLAFSVVAIRRHRLRDQAAVLWLLVSLVLVCATVALPLGLLNRVAHVVGIRYASDLLLVLAVILLVMLVFHLSISLAALRKTQRGWSKNLQCSKQHRRDLVRRFRFRVCLPVSTWIPTC